MDDPELVAAVRSAAGPGQSLFDEPTRLGDIDSGLVDQTRPEDALVPTDSNADSSSSNFLDAATEISTGAGPGFGRRGGYDGDEEATRMASIDALARKHPPPPRSQGGRHEERTRAVDIRNDPNININDVDWDID